LSEPLTSGRSFWPSICLPSQISMVGFLSTTARLNCAFRSLVLQAFLPRP
jgi:hypothetical protein